MCVALVYDHEARQTFRTLQKRVPYGPRVCTYLTIDRSSVNDGEDLEPFIWFCILVKKASGRHFSEQVLWLIKIIAD